MLLLLLLFLLMLLLFLLLLLLCAALARRSQFRRSTFPDVGFVGTALAGLFSALFFRIVRIIVIFTVHVPLLRGSPAAFVLFDLAVGPAAVFSFTFV